MPSDRIRPSCAAYGLGVLALASACDRVRPADPVILAVGDQQVRRSEFDRYVREAEARGQGELDADGRRSLLEAWLERRVLVLEARRRGLLGAASSGDDEASAVRKLLAADALADVEVGEAEVQQYYTQHAAEFESPETVTVRQILVPTSNEARDVRRRLRRDARSFAVLAQTVSRSPEAAAGGLMGTFARGQLPAELERAAFALAEGETSEVVQTPLGYHVLRLDARTPARTASLEESKAAIRARLAEEKADRKVREYVAGLLARAKVNHEAAIVRTQ